MSPAAALRAVKVVHTVVWAFFAGCVLAIPVAAGMGELRAAAVLIGVVLVEVAVLALNRWRCPLTDVAARFTDDRRNNFDIYLPACMARWNRWIFGALFVAGVGLTLGRCVAS